MPQCPSIHGRRFFFVEALKAGLSPTIFNPVRLCEQLPEEEQQDFLGPPTRGSYLLFSFRVAAMRFKGLMSDRFGAEIIRWEGSLQN